MIHWMEFVLVTHWANTGACGVTITDTILGSALMACVSVTLIASAVQVGVHVNAGTATLHYKGLTVIEGIHVIIHSSWHWIEGSEYGEEDDYGEEDTHGDGLGRRERGVR